VRTGVILCRIATPLTVIYSLDVDATVDLIGLRAWQLFIRGNEPPWLGSLDV
jgi:hypothetical protein